MRPTPIPDHEVWAGGIRRVISPPGGDLTNDQCAPVEAIIDVLPGPGAVALSVRCVLEDGDLETLAAGGLVWLTFGGHMVPWAISVVPPVPVPNSDGA